MTLEEKVDILFNHLHLDGLLFQAREEKNENVRKQDFEAAVKSREKEVEIMKQLKQNLSVLADVVAAHKATEIKV